MDDIILVFHLPFDGICFFLEKNNIYERIESEVCIVIGTIEITAKTQQVLAVQDQTVQLIGQHRPIRVPSCPMN